MLVGNEDRYYYVLFSRYSPERSTFFWRLVNFCFCFRHPSLAHVDLALPVGGDRTLILTSSPWQICPLVYEKSIEDYLEEALKNIPDMRACIKFKSVTQSDNYRARGIITCISFVKAVLGLRGFFLVTPYQLFKKLKKMGGTVLCQPQQYQ